MNTGLSFVCRDEDNFKDNSRHCVCCPLVLSFSLYIFFALVFTLFFALVSGLIFRVPAYVFSPFFFSVFPFFFSSEICIYSVRVFSRVRNQVSIKLILFFEV